MLLGEFAVLENKPCLVTAVDSRMRVEIEVLNKAEFQLDASGVNLSRYKKPIREVGAGEIPKGASFVEIAVRNFLSKYPQPPLGQGKVKGLQGVRIITKSEFSAQVGFGSSSASAVCVIKGLSEFFRVKLSQKEIFDLAYKTVLDVQGRGSGFDVAAAVYGGTLYFVRGGRIIEPLAVGSLPLVVGYSGTKADTVEIITTMHKETASSVLERIYTEISKIVEKGKREISKTHWKAFGDLMNRNQTCLQDLGVSTEKLNIMTAAALSAGAYGAKLSGAGGGDCMIAISPENKRPSVIDALEKAGGQIIEINTGASGVRIEKNL
jgi:mevalonate kinase